MVVTDPLAMAGMAMLPSLPCPSFSILFADVAGRGVNMPSLFRFLTLIGVLAGLVYGGMFLLATWFDPKPREITVSIPPDKFAKQQQ
jgi:hypothetical protein